ncbi:MAG: carbon-nitrogen hydrolase family protein [Eggerthellaceae bacterium]|nr:carbon-nitrogen hydrolase family protein [Eggerthellaceae bacterium]
MALRLGLAQSKHPDDRDVVALVDAFAERAVFEGVNLLAFPESLMSRYEQEAARFTAESQPVDGPFGEAVSEIAARRGLWIVYTMNEANPDHLPFNTAVVVDDRGARRGVYRKVHLFDAQGYSESERMSAGDELFEPIETPFGKLGLGICYDLRFPELARRAALSGCDLLVYPSAWVAGNGKVRQWETLLAARAIENGIFVAGCCRADDGYVGHSCVFGPDGTLVAEGGEDEELLVANVDLEEINRVRTATPSLLHRRPDLY